MSAKQKRVAAIHDLSGFGRCSLAVIIPVISAMGIQCVPVPTAVLSTHTGGFKDFVLQDMTGYIPRCREHYERLGIELDAVYTGFLASEEQAYRCMEFFDAFPSALKVVDPVMGDNGEAYSTYTDGMIQKTLELVGRADVITPNLTEAALILGEPYPDELTAELLFGWLTRLCEKCPSVVLTGAALSGGGYGSAFMKRGEEPHLIRIEKIPAFYPGTGDIFASVLTGALLLGRELGEAAKCATDFCTLAINATYGSGEMQRNGVEFERVLSFLTDFAANNAEE